MSAASDMSPPDHRLALLERALRHFAPVRGSRFMVLYTDRRRPTQGWKGLTDPEVLILEERGYATASAEESDGRRRVTLTKEAIRVRNNLAARPR